jgi:hypothetical protein
MSLFIVLITGGIIARMTLAHTLIGQWLRSGYGWTYFLGCILLLGVIEAVLGLFGLQSFEDEDWMKT